MGREGSKGACHCTEGAAQRELYIGYSFLCLLYVHGFTVGRDDSFRCTIERETSFFTFFFWTCMTKDHGTCRNTLYFTQLQAIKKRQWAPFLFHSRQQPTNPRQVFQLSNQICILNKYNKYLDQFISTCPIVSLLIFM